MKRLIPLLALFAAGIVVSFAFASPPPGHGLSTGSSVTSAGPGKSGQHGNAKCHPINLKGHVAGGTITLDSISKAAGPQAGKITAPATLTVSGKVSVQAWMCSATGAAPATPTLFLKQLHVGGSPHNLGSTTTTTGP